MRRMSGAVKLLSSVLAFVLLISGFTSQPGMVVAQDEGPQVISRDVEVVNPYYTVEHLVLKDGSAIDRNIINGPSKPLNEKTHTQSAELDSNAITLVDFPSFSWMFGCSAVSAGMAATFYDNFGFSNMYTGPTNGGVYPITDSGWPLWWDGDKVYSANPLVASLGGVDGRTVRGSIEDYWVQVDSGADDPYITNGWTQHQWGSSVGDYMKTSRSSYGNVDGATTFYTWQDSPDQLTCADIDYYGILDDGSTGIRDFYQARGYQVGHCYNQATDNNGGGFTLAMFQSYINLDYPILINLAGHTVIGYGYSGSTIYIRDTWSSDPNYRPTMTWGGSYQGLPMQSVSVVLPIQNQVTSQKVYLPAVSKPPIVVNGDFEMGHTVWNEYSSNGFSLIWNDPGLARQGNWSAWLGGSDNEVSSLTQVVTIPTANSMLQFYYAAVSSEAACQYDYFWVLVGENLVFADWLCTEKNTNGYVPYAIDLSAYAGTTQPIKFYIQTDSSVNSNFFLDDVSITRYAANSEELPSNDPLDPIFFQTK